VFGNEETGSLRRASNLARGSAPCPTSDKMLSMNLSHAVAVALGPDLLGSEVIEAAAKNARKKAPAHLRRVSRSLDGMMRHWAEF